MHRERNVELDGFRVSPNGISFDNNPSIGAMIATTHEELREMQDSDVENEEISEETSPRCLQRLQN